MHTPVRLPTTPKAVKAAPLHLSRRMTVEPAFQRILHGCIAQIEANREGVARFHDSESLHQMRVGLRRLRAALRVFEDRLALSPWLANELDWLSGALGEARDWDVLTESTLPRVQAALDGAAERGAPLAPLRQAAQQAAGAHRFMAGEAVGSGRFVHFLLRLKEWLDARGWRASLLPGDKAKLKMRVTKLAGATLARDQRRLRKRGATLRQAGPDGLHRIRIAAKKTRYAAEFFGSLYPQKQVRPYVKALAGLQDELGWLNDAAVAQRLLDELSRDQPALAAGAQLGQGYLAAAIEEGKSKAWCCWKAFEPLRPPGAC